MQNKGKDAKKRGIFMDISKLDFIPFENALKSLEEGLNKPPQNDLERDGVIQRFEYCFELAWKMIRKSLLALGRNEVSASPKPLFREALNEGWIENSKDWLAFTEARNSTSHLYNKKEAEKIYQVIKTFPAKAKFLLKKLQALQ